MCRAKMAEIVTRKRLPKFDIILHGRLQHLRQNLSHNSNTIFLVNSHIYWHVVLRVQQHRLENYPIYSVTHQKIVHVRRRIQITGLVHSSQGKSMVPFAACHPMYSSGRWTLLREASGNPLVCQPVKTRTCTYTPSQEQECQHSTGQTCHKYGSRTGNTESNNNKAFQQLRAGSVPYSNTVSNTIAVTEILYLTW